MQRIIRPRLRVQVKQERGEFKGECSQEARIAIARISEGRARRGKKIVALRSENQRAQSWTTKTTAGSPFKMKYKITQRNWQDKELHGQWKIFELSELRSEGGRKHTNTIDRAPGRIQDGERKKKSNKAAGPSYGKGSTGRGNLTSSKEHLICSRGRSRGQTERGNNVRIDLRYGKEV